MPQSKLTGPCSVHNCTQEAKNFCHLTEYAWKKALAHETLQQYPYLQTDQQLCYPFHYLAIVEPDHHELKEKQTAEHDISNEDSFIFGSLLWPVI